MFISIDVHCLSNKTGNINTVFNIYNLLECSRIFRMAAPANPIAEPTLFVNSQSCPNHTTKILFITFSTG